MSNTNSNANLVSIVMPVYNGELFLKEAIESVEKQTYDNWELIIINDGSTDNTDNICLEFSSNPKIKYIKINNSGVSVARNKGIENCSGDYITFMDADDLLPKDGIEKLLEPAKIYNVDIVIAQSYVLKSKLIEPKNNSNVSELLTGKDALRLYFHHRISSSVWGNLFSMDTIKDIRFYPGLNRGEDVMFMYDLFLSNLNSRVYYSNELTYIYRVTSDSLSHYDFKKHNKVLDNYEKHLLALNELFLKHKDTALQHYHTLNANGIGMYLSLYLQFLDKYERQLPPDYLLIYNNVKPFLSGQHKIILYKYEILSPEEFDNYLKKLRIKNKLESLYNSYLRRFFYKFLHLIKKIVLLLSK